MKGLKKLIIIPAYNEEGNILKVVEDITKYASEFDYLVINDCSTDQTRKVCEENNINLINLPINLGIGGAVQTGYMYAYQNNYDIVVQFDGDGQHNARYLNDIVTPIIREGANMVIGSRFIEMEGYQSTRMRRFGISFLSSLIKVCTNERIYDPTSGYRAIDKKTAEHFANKYPKDYPEPETIVFLTRIDYHIQEIPVEMNERVNGRSSIHNLKSLYYMLKVSFAILIDRIKPKNP